MIQRALLVILLIAAIGWGRMNTPPRQEYSPIHTAPWSESNAIWHHAIAGPVPALSADLAILEIYNIYDQAKAAPAETREAWWSALRYQLYLGQHMDPYFRDIYRLTEGLLAYEAQKTEDAISILSKSDPYTENSDPLLAAAFLAKQELNDQPLALSLALKAARKADASQLAIGFAAAIIKGQGGCRAALAYLNSRLDAMPEKYQQGIIRRIERLKQERGCREEI